MHTKIMIDLRCCTQTLNGLKSKFNEINTNHGVANLPKTELSVDRHAASDSYSSAFSVFYDAVNSSWLGTWSRIAK